MSDASHPITTLTGNLLWERTLIVPDWEPGKTARAASETFQVGGKGINVSKMLNRLKAPNTALLFASGSTGSDCTSWLAEHGITHRAFHSEFSTRIGIVVRTEGRPETTFLGPDVAPGQAAVQACADHLDSMPGGVLAICGSLPGWQEANFKPLRDSLERWAARGSLCVDTYGAPLAWFAEHSVDLIKINRQEFDALSGGKGEVSLRLAKALQEWPVKAWIVTDGPGAVWVASHGRTRSMTPPPVREVSATGSGDVLLACALQGKYCQGLDWEQATAFALPFASANAAHPGIAEFPLT